MTHIWDAFSSFPKSGVIEDNSEEEAEEQEDFNQQLDG
jgi:hypothetical protein